MCDRFSGEAQEPPVWGWCAYCGAPIHMGHAYYAHADGPVCDECAARFAWALFEAQVVRCIAEEDEG